MNRDTICAIATPTGGAISIIRISGPKALSIVASVCRKNFINKKRFLSSITDQDGIVIDEAIISVFYGPYSYTGEDSAEINCHGSRYIAQRIIDLLIEKGCRMALPGEYTQRAFINGKLDLSQAEAVADLIASTNKATHQMAMSQLRGHFSSELTQLRDQLLHLTSLMELELDFSEHEDLEFANRNDLLNLAHKIEKKINQLATSFRTGQALKEGIPVAIVGKTNVGKSTLLNRLLHEERAIVSDIHGTTRDTIEDTIDIHGIQFRFIDTAGFRQTTDTIEQIGIERTLATIEKARIVLWLYDKSPTEEEIADMANRCQGRILIPVRNKIDLGNAFPYTEISSHPTINISAKQGQGIENLEEAIYKSADIPDFTENDVIITNARHYEALIHASANLKRVVQGIENSLSSDIIAEDLRLVLHDLGEITGGTITSQETLNNIFKNFCVGK